MCGFAGFTNPTSESKAETRIKENDGATYSEHRGPDAESIFIIVKKSLLGHYRLIYYRYRRRATATY